MFFYVLDIVFTLFAFWAFLNISNRLGYVRAIWPTGLAIAFSLLCYRLIGWVEWRWEHVVTILATALGLWVLTRISRAARPGNDRP